MIIRLSHRLGSKIGVKPTQSIPLHSNPFADWSAHLFNVERIQYIIMVNTISLYSVMTFGKGITDEDKLFERMIDALKELLQKDEFHFIWERLILPETTSVRFSKSYNRAVIGSMNDMIRCAKYLLMYRRMSPLEISSDLNEMPMSMIEHIFPIDEFRSQTLD